MESGIARRARIIVRLQLGDGIRVPFVLKRLLVALRLYKVVVYRLRQRLELIVRGVRGVLQGLYLRDRGLNCVLPRAECLLSEQTGIKRAVFESLVKRLQPFALTPSF